MVMELKLNIFGWFLCLFYCSFRKLIEIFGGLLVILFVFCYFLYVFVGYLLIK